MNIIAHYPLLPCLLELLAKVILFSAGVVVIASWVLDALTIYLPIFH